MKEKSVLENRLMPLMEMASSLPDDFNKMEHIMKMIPEDRRGMIGGFMDPLSYKMGVSAMKAFSSYFKNLQQGRKEGKKIILHSFNIPPEIFHALDVVPIFTELFTTLAVNVFPNGAEKYIDYCHEKGLSDSLCSAQLGGVGPFLLGDEPKPDIVVSGAPGSCDTNSKAMEYCAKTLNVPYLQIDTPAYNDERGLDYYKTAFRDVISGIEDISGQKLDPDRLKGVVESSNKATELYHEINELRRAVPCPVPNMYSLLSYGMRFTTVGQPKAVPFFEAALESSKERMKRGEGALSEENVRCLWVYTSIYFDPELFGWLESIGMTVLMDMLGWFPISPIETSSTDAMIDGLAEEMFNYPMTRQMRGPWDAFDSWTGDVVHLAKMLKADCCIFTGHMACKRAWGTFGLLNTRIKEDIGIPTLTLEADSWDKRITSTPAIKGKIEDFLEMVI